MSRVIWKYPLVLQPANVLEIPAGASILTIQTQGRVPVLWALVDPAAALEKRYIMMAGTGFSAPPRAAHLATTQHYDGALVFHWFEEVAHS